jgi:hypothetical protein
MNRYHYYEPDSVTYEGEPDTEAGQIRNWPDCAGEWQMVSTGELAIATETTDIEDCPMFTIMIDGDGPFMSIDFPNEKFEKL